MKEAMLLAVAVIVMFAVLICGPALLIWSAVDHVRHAHKRERRSGSSGAGGFGSAMQELDRLVARPSVEHVVEAQTQTLRREDDQGGQ